MVLEQKFQQRLKAKYQILTKTNIVNLTNYQNLKK